MGEKRPPRLTLVWEPILGFLKRRDIMFSQACPFAAVQWPWVGQAREWGVGYKMNRVVSFGGEPYSSSINTCALNILSLTAEFTIIPISQSDKLRLGERLWCVAPSYPECKGRSSPFPSQ